MNTLSKAFSGTVAVGALVLSSVSPAFADDFGHRRGHDGISAGDVIAGALVIGGIAAIVSAANRENRDYRYDRAGYGWDDGYRGNNGNPRQAVEQCVYAAERTASRYGYGRADVTDIRGVRDTRWGYEVQGRITVNPQGRDWRNGDGNYGGNYGQGWGGDYRGWGGNARGYDSGSFKCRFERGRVADLDFGGLRGL